MQASVLIAAHNEGEQLWKTVQSALGAVGNLRCEFIVADDASTDGSVDEVRRRFPQVRIVASEKRGGPSPTKDLAARSASGRVLVFLDGHTKPEASAIERLVRTIRSLLGRAILTPRIVHLECDRWENDPRREGFGFYVDLEDLSCGWTGREALRWRRGFYESPTLIGCAFAISRRLYRKLRGFDPHMIQWGVEDIDLGLKSWLMGYPVLTTPYATAGHRFRGTFDNYDVSDHAVLFNKLRMARKNFTERVWEEWVDHCREREPADVWRLAWETFDANRETIEDEREYLMARRRHDEFWYADRFGLSWPRRPDGKIRTRS